MFKARLLLFIFSLFLFVACDQGVKSDYTEEIPIEDYEYIGNASCAECHEAEFHNWKNSDHDKAMDIANDSTVLGDFNNRTVNFRNIESRFYKRDGKFYAFTEGPEGEMEEFEITHTFGHYPLQQYLIPFEGGRYQVLPITWDSKQNVWYHMADSVYAELDIPPNDWLHWTNGAQNWNGMCAECHSTNLNKNYDVESKTYSTTWSEIDVSCEACHGPASRHLDWARNHEDEDWDFTGFAAKTTGLTSEETLSQCAYCHARRSSFDDYDNFGQHYLDQFAPQLINENFYYLDGQIREEDYVFTSFTQTRMHSHNIKCSDCHEPHNLRTKQQGNLLCLQCHDHRIYETEDHHFHKKTGKGQSEDMTTNGFYDQGDGTQCVDCHMTGQKFMGIDFRRDHSFRMPNPIVSKQIGSPDACTSCHTDMSQIEAAEKLKEWYPESEAKRSFAVEFQAILDGQERDTKFLEEMIGDTSVPLMLQASAINFLSRSEMPYSPAIEKSLKDTSALMRYAAVRYYQSQNQNEYINNMIVMLDDPYRAMRMEAARNLLEIAYSPTDSIIKGKLDSGVQEFIEHQEYGADFASSRHNLAVYYVNKNETEKAIDYLKEAVRIDDQYYPAMLELAILYSRNGRNDLAEKWLKYTLDKDPLNASALRFMGLLSAEMKNYNEAINYLDRAIEVNPSDSRNYYNAGLIAQESKDLKKSERYLMQAVEIDPYNRDYLYALAYFYLQIGELENAKLVSGKLIELYPNDPAVQSLVRTLKKP